MPVFRGISELAAEGCLVKPLFHQYFQDPTIPMEFVLHVSRPLQRQPDRWFHASQHPTASDRELWLWLTGRSEPEAMGYISLMSVMFGSLGHAVIEAFLDYAGIAVPLPEGPCPACCRPRRKLRARPDPSKYCSEHGAVHLETRSRCHLDSILHFASQGTFGFDFKTIRPFGLKGVPDMDAEAFKAKWPGYWAQMQECMRITGLRRYIVFFLGLGNPWDTREFHFDFDPVFAAQTEAKYKRVLSCVERGMEILL